MISSNPTKEKLSVMVKQAGDGELKGEGRPELFIMIPKSLCHQHQRNAAGANRPEYNLGKISSQYMILLSRKATSPRNFA